MNVNCTLKNGLDDKFYVICILTQKEKSWQRERGVLSDLFWAGGGVVQFKGRDRIVLFQSGASPLPPISTGSRSVCESEVGAALLFPEDPTGGRAY